MGVIEELVRDARARARSLPKREPTAASGDRRSFDDALRGKEHLSVIAEYKQASPSEGAIAERELSSRVRAYESAGAAAVSVLTEPSRFGGSIEDLRQAAAHVSIPVLMKDFIVSPSQIAHAQESGARAILLIVRCLSRAELDELAGCARHAGLTPLVECHEPSELERALDIDGAVIGVNNRNLDTLAVDTGLAPKLLAELPPERVVVAESGYHAPEDLVAIRGIADAVLIGSALMKLDDPGPFIREVRS